MFTVDHAFVWFPCASNEEWVERTFVLSVALCRLFPNVQTILYPTWAETIDDALIVVFHLGAAAIIVEHPQWLGWSFSSNDESPTLSGLLYPEPTSPVGLAWTLRDESQPLLACYPPGKIADRIRLGERHRGDRTADQETGDQLPLEELYPDGLITLTLTSLPDARTCSVFSVPEPGLGIPVASWIVPYPQPDVFAALPFVVETACTTSVVSGLQVTGETTSQTSLALCGSCHILSSFRWEQRAGAPAPVLAASILGFVWCADDWTAAPPVWEVGSVQLLVQSLGTTTRLAAFGNIVVGPLAAAALESALTRELSAQHLWSAPVLLPDFTAEPLPRQPINPRDRTIIDLYRAGKTYKEIAEHLGLRDSYVARLISQLRRRYPDLPYRNRRAAEHARQRRSEAR